MGREEILLKEYEACRQDITDTASRYWTIVGIFVPVDVILLGGAGFALQFEGSAINWKIALLVTLLGIGITVIICFLYRWGVRMNWYIKVGWHRIHEIEAQLNMLKNRTIHWLENPKVAPSEQQDRLKSVKAQCGSPPSKEMQSVRGIFWTLAILWMLFILFTWILAYSNYISRSNL